MNEREPRSTITPAQTDDLDAVGRSYYAFCLEHQVDDAITANEYTPSTSAAIAPTESSAIAAYKPPMTDKSQPETHQMLNLIHAFLLGAWEFRSYFTTHHDDLALADAYDAGREAAHRLTLRHFER